MNDNLNSDDHGKTKLCPKCNLAAESRNDALCQQCKQPLVDLIEPIEGTYQTTQPYEQTKKPAESLQDTNTLLFATLPIEKVSQPESAKSKQTTKSIWEKKASFSGTSIGNYHRLEFVAMWRFGTIYSAEHVLLGNKVRLFVMDTTNEESLPLQSWFLETAAALAKVDHQHIDEYMLDYGQFDDKAYVCISESTHNASNYLGEYAKKPRLDEPKEGMSIVLSNLVRGLTSLHSLGLCHGSINQKHIRQGKSPEAAVFCPLATGFPGENIVDQSGKISRNIHACKRQDFRDLIIAYIRELQGDNPKPIPKNVSKKWLHRQFHTIPPNLADVIIKLFWIGSSAKAIEEILTQLDKSTNSPLRKITWKERSYGVATDTLTLILYSFPISIATVLSIGNLKPAYQIISVSLALVILAIPLIIWEPIFNSTIGKKGEYFLVELGGEIPSRRRRLARSTIRLATWFFFSNVILGILFSIDALKPTDQYDKLASLPLIFKFGYFSFSLGIAMVYAMSIFFRGETFHDWITKTFWVTYRSRLKTNVLKQHISDVLGLKNKPARNIYVPENGSSVAEVNDVVVGDIIGRGGMGIVYQGWDKKVKRPVAIKLISNTNEITDEAILRFRREAEIGSNLSHPNVAKVYSVGYLENHPYILLEYVDGETLNEIVKRHGPIQPVLAWQIIRQAAKALQATENLGIVHRDIKPSNIMLTRDGIVKIMDFGVSSIAHTSTTIEKGSTIESGKDLDHPFQDQTQLTRTGIALGTPQYMSPEQIKGERVDFRSDIYSLGLTLYTLLSGKPAFEGGMQEIYSKQCTENPPDLNLPELGPHQHRVIEKMLAKNKEDRYQNYQDILVDLDQTEPEEAQFPDGRDLAGSLFIDVYICIVILSYIDVVFHPAGLIDTLYNGRWSLFLLSALPAFVAKVALCGFYFGFSSWRYGSTLGQRLFRLKVLPKNGYKLQRRHALLRSAILASWTYLGYLLFNSFALDFINRDLDRPFLHRLIVHASFVTFAFLFFLLPLTTVVMYSAAVRYSRNDFRSPLDRLTGTRVVKMPKRNKGFGLNFLFSLRPKK